MTTPSKAATEIVANLQPADWLTGSERRALATAFDAFAAAHRLAAEQRGREAERAEICAWLRDQSPCKLQSAGYLADAIEARQCKDAP
jgi:hypothetical protein